MRSASKTVQGLDVQPSLIHNPCIQRSCSSVPFSFSPFCFILAAVDSEGAEFHIFILWDRSLVCFSICVERVSLDFVRGSFMVFLHKVINFRVSTPKAESIKVRMIVQTWYTWEELLEYCRFLLRRHYCRRSDSMIRWYHSSNFYQFPFTCLK